MKKDIQNFNKMQVGLSASSHFIVDIYQSFIVGLIPFLTLKFGLSLFEVGLLTATSIIANSLFSPFFGLLSDRYGLKYFIVLAPIVTSVLLTVVGILPDYFLILIFLFLGNLGIAAFHPASAAIAGHYGGEKKGFGSSMISFGGNFGYALGSLIIILFIDGQKLGYSPLMIIPGIIIALILFKYIPGDRKTNFNKNDFKFFTRLKKISRKKLKSIIVIIIVIYSLNIIWNTLVTYMPLYYTESGIGLIDIGIILFLFGMLGGASGIVTGLWFDKFKNGIAIIQIMLIISIPLIFFTFKTEGIFSLILFILSGASLISILPLCIRISQDLLPGNISLASSLILGFSPGLAAVTIIFLGKIADNIGIVKLVNYELFLLAAALLILFFYPSKI